MIAVDAITIKLPEELLRQLRREATATQRSVGAVIRERLEGSSTPRAEPGPGGEAAPPEGSVYALIPDLVGSLAGSGRGATNARRKFRRR